MIDDRYASNYLDRNKDLFENEDCVGVEGKTFYESHKSLTVTDYHTQRLVPGGFMTCNVAYLRDSIINVGYFDPKFRYVYEDRDLAMRIKKLGKIYFESNDTTNVIIMDSNTSILELSKENKENEKMIGMFVSSLEKGTFVRFGRPKNWTNIIVIGVVST